MRSSCGASHDVAAAVLRGVAVAAAETARDDAAPLRARVAVATSVDDVSGSARLPHLRARRCRASPAGEHLAARSVVRHRRASRQPPCTATAKHTAHTKTDSEQHTIGEYELFGRAAVALRKQQRVAQDAERERDDRDLEPGLLEPTVADFSKAHRQYARIATLDATPRT